MTDADLYPMRRLWGFHGGVHPVQHKRESNGLPVLKADLPGRLTLPLHQHIGAPAEPIVQVGDLVLKGQRIAKAKGYVSAPLHAPTSGRIIDIGEYPVPHPSGLAAPCIVIESDGEDRWIDREPIANFLDLEPSELRNRIRDAGIVGLGGAGFPSYIKMNPGGGKVIETLILNGVECEPYITCDDALMRRQSDEIVGGMNIVRHALQARECLIAIEDNKPDAIAAMRGATEGMEGVEVVPVPTQYPQGGEKQLVQVLTGKEVPSDSLCASVGVVGTNVGTAAAVYNAVHHGTPLISRLVTVTGDGIGRPRNLEVLIGTRMDELITACHGDLDRIERIVMGGPMMGFSMSRADLPVIKTTNCILALCPESAPSHTAMPCIRCGACADACPINLLPQQLYWFSKFRDLERVQEYNLFDCIECGCCTYVCPSHIPLVQYFRYAKGDIWITEREKEKADLARRRHESRQIRIEREKAEAAALRAKKRAALEKAKAGGEDARKSEIDAAMKRAESRRKSAMAQADAQRQKAHGQHNRSDEPQESPSPERKADRTDGGQDT